MLQSALIHVFAILIAAPSFCCAADNPQSPAPTTPPTSSPSPVPLPPGPPPLTYRISPDCRQSQGFMDGLSEALILARRGAERLSSTTDTLQKRYFQMIFNQFPIAGTPPQLTPVANQIIRYFNGIVALTEHDVQAESNIRFHCDNDAFGPGQRWTLVPDRPGDPIPNSQRTLATGQERQDLSNGIRTAGYAGCQQPDTSLYGNTFKGLSMGPGFNNQNFLRSTVTICDRSLLAQILALNDFSTISDLSADGNTLDKLDSITSVTILHELTHAMPFTRIDVNIPGNPTANPPTEGRTAYGWAAVQALGPADSVLNAENYAFFGLLARLGDRGFRLYISTQGAVAGRLTYNRRSITSKAKRIIETYSN